MNKIDNLKLYKDCLIIVDMVNGFVREGVLHDEEISKIIPTQIKLIKEAKETKQLIIFIKDNHRQLKNQQNSKDLEIQLTVLKEQVKVK